MRSQWTRAWLLGPLGASNFASDDGQFATAAFANGFHFMKKALVWFQAEKTTPSPIILAQDLPREQQLRYADLLGWPSDFAAWGRFISFLLRIISSIPVTLYPDVLLVFEVWQNALVGIRNSCSRAILTRCTEWLSEIDRMSRSDAADTLSAKWMSTPELREFRKALANSIFRAARSEPSFAEGYLKRVIASKHMREDRFEEIVAFAPILALSQPQLLVELTLKHLQEELPDDLVARERAEAARASEYRKRAQAKPANERTRDDDLAISGVFSPFRFHQFSVMIGTPPRSVGTRATSGPRHRYGNRFMRSFSLHRPKPFGSCASCATTR